MIRRIVNKMKSITTEGWLAAILVSYAVISVILFTYFLAKEL